ncbi:MAG: DUF1289 domain-containing protein [Pseudomonadota bacterium]
MTAPSRPISPCVGVCELDEVSGYCLGCARTGDEIAAWSRADEAERQVVWAALPARFEALGVTCRRLAWNIEHIRHVTADGLAQGRYMAVLGVVGALGEFMPGPNAPIDVRLLGNVLTARTEGAALRLHLEDTARALAFSDKDPVDSKQPIALVAPRQRRALPTVSVLTALGPDRKAITEVGKTGLLFDLGLGRQEVRFMVRVADDRSREMMEAHLGMPLLEALPKIGSVLIRMSPLRVIETPLGRVEITTPIPSPGGQSPNGPHTHLLPAYLASGRTMPAGMDIPESYLPGTLLYPV